MHVPINVKSPNNISEWQMGFNLTFKGLSLICDKIVRTLGRNVRCSFPLLLSLQILFKYFYQFATGLFLIASSHNPNLPLCHAFLTDFTVEVNLVL